jgi:catechol 2,3-dioxygenase
MSDAPVIPAATSMGPVRLVVGDLDAMAAFYTRALGLEALARDRSGAVLGAGGRPLVELVSAPDAPRRAPRTTGLFHLALLVPTRAELARALRRVAAAGWRFSGASDHLVSEALYLDDPEGNGIEIYRDRPRHEWRTGPGGEPEMATLRIDIDGVLAALPDGADPGMPAGTVMGHVHLQVRDTGEAEGFWSGLLGFEPTARGYPGALFVAAGGYHHHLGLNTWGTRDAPAPPAGSRGLDRLTVDLPGSVDVERIAARLGDAGLDPVPVEGGVAVADPSGNRVVLASPG